jgi:hypothetical protein
VEVERGGGIEGRKVDRGTALHCTALCPADISAVKCFVLFCSVLYCTVLYLLLHCIVVYLLLQ